MRKQRILFLSEFSQLNSGYAIWFREIMSRLHISNMFEIAELASYCNPLIPQHQHLIQTSPWPVIPVCPSNQEEERVYHENMKNQFGKHKFEETCLDFKPDTCLTIRDFWYENWIDESPFRKYVNWLWVSPCDSPNQSKEWLDIYSKCDGLFAYNSWSKKTLEEEGDLKVLDVFPPGNHPAYQPITLEQKEQLKAQVGLANSNIIGMISRNQRRKLYYDLFKTFRRFLDKTQLKNTYLMCVFGHPDNIGWPINELIKDHGLGSKFLILYQCHNCNFAFPAFWSDIHAVCPRCHQVTAKTPNVTNGTSCEILAKVYQLLDLYVQYSMAEGSSFTIMEAAACGVHVMAPRHSAMIDAIEKCSGTFIDVKELCMELETGCLRAVPNHEHLIEEMTKFFRLPRQIQHVKGHKSYQSYKNYYDWNKTAQKVAYWIRQFPPKNLWNGPPNFHNPAQLDQNILHQTSNSEYVDWLITYIMGEPHRLNTYFALKILRDLNNGASNSIPGALFDEQSVLFQRQNYHPFNREDAYKLMLEYCNRHNYWEQRRIEKFCK